MASDDSLGLDGPLRRGVLAGLLVRLGIGSGLVDDALGVVARRVHRIDLHRLVAGVDDVVPRAGRHLHGPAVTDVLHDGGLVLVLVGAQDALARAAVQTQELIGLGVHLPTDGLPHRDRHERHLQVLAGPRRRAVIGVLLGGSLQIEDVGLGSVVHNLHVVLLPSVGVSGIAGDLWHTNR